MWQQLRHGCLALVAIFLTHSSTECRQLFCQLLKQLRLQLVAAESADAGTGGPTATGATAAAAEFANQWKPACSFTLCDAGGIGQLHCSRILDKCGGCSCCQGHLRPSAAAEQRLLSWNCCSLRIQPPGWQHCLRRLAGLQDVLTPLWRRQLHHIVGGCSSMLQCQRRVMSCRWWRAGGRRWWRACC